MRVLDSSESLSLETSAELDEALVALRSGAWLTVAGDAMLLGALVISQLSQEAGRLDVSPVAWVMLIVVLVGQCAVAATVEIGRPWIRRTFSADAIYRYLWSTSMIEGLALAIGIVLAPAAMIQLSLMTLMMVVFAGYFYKSWQAISFILFAVLAGIAAVVIAEPPAVTPSAFTASSVMPLLGVTLMAGGFVATVRRSRDRVERRARVVAAVGLARALDLRDPNTARHSDTVAGYAAQMAQRLGLPPRAVERVHLAGILHDVGKIGIPDAVLLKPGKLSEAEWEQMRGHPQLGAQMLDSTTLRDVRKWVLAHHERPDGRGYPSGLQGDEIPLEARILAVADSFEAMTADRVYRTGMPVQDAVQELIRCSGTQFDPRVVDAFLQSLGMHGPGGLELMPRAVDRRAARGLGRSAHHPRAGTDLARSKHLAGRLTQA